MLNDTVIFATTGMPEDHAISQAKKFIQFHELTPGDVKIVRVEKSVYVKNKRPMNLKSGFIEWLNKNGTC